MVKAWYVVYVHPSRIVGILIEASLIPKLYNDNDNIDSTTCSQVKELLSMGADTDAKDKLLISTGFDQKKAVPRLDRERQDYLGKTALDLARNRGFDQASDFSFEMWASTCPK